MTFYSYCDTCRRPCEVLRPSDLENPGLPAGWSHHVAYATTGTPMVLTVCSPECKAAFPWKTETP